MNKCKVVCISKFLSFVILAFSSIELLAGHSIENTNDNLNLSSSSSEPLLIRQPENCDSKCLMSTLEDPAPIKNFGIQLGNRSAIFVESENSLILLKGQIIATQENQVINTEYGSVSIIDPKSKVLIVRKENQIEVSVLSGNASVSARRSKLGTIKLNQGMSFWIGPIKSDGYSAEGYPQSIKSQHVYMDLKKVLSKADLNQQMKLIQKEQSRWIASTTELYKQVSSEIEAALAERNAIREAKLKKEQAERDKARRLYRQKMLIAPEDPLN